LGGVITLTSDLADLDFMFSFYREINNMNAELKWTKVSTQKYLEYQNFLDIFFENRNKILFKSMVVDMLVFDHKKFHNNDKELGFYKMMYQFLLNSFGKYLRANDQVIIHLDQRTHIKYKLSTLCAILNNGLQKKYPTLNHPIRNIEAIDSKKSSLMQLADVLMGAIGFEWNHLHEVPGSKQAKIDLANYIKQKTGRYSLACDTPISSSSFSIWKIDFSKSKKRK